MAGRKLLYCAVPHGGDRRLDSQPIILVILARCARGVTQHRAACDARVWASFHWAVGALSHSLPSCILDCRAMSTLKWDIHHDSAPSVSVLVSLSVVISGQPGKRCFGACVAWVQLQHEVSTRGTVLWNKTSSKAGSPDPCQGLALVFRWVKIY